MKRLTVLAAIVVLALPAMASAKDMTGKYGLGYFHNDAPVGARCWLNEKVGIDFGLGFNATPIYVDHEKKTATSFWVEAGVPYVIKSTDQANFFVRPGIMLAQLDDRVYEMFNGIDKRWTKVTVSLTPGAEVFFGEHFSLEAGHGIAFDIVKVPDHAEVPDYRRGNTETTIRTFDASVTYLGFHFYFK